MIEITQNFYRPKKQRRNNIFFALFVLLFMNASISWGQTQAIGSFPNTQGGFENQTVATFVPSNLSNTAWSAKGSGSSIWSVRDATTSSPRTGAKYANFPSGLSTGKYMASPTALTIPASTPYTIQFFYRTANATTTSTSYLFATVPTSSTAMPSSGQISLAGTSGVWTKKNVSYTSSSTASDGTGYLGLRVNGTSTTIAVDFDDFVVYPGSLDNTVPNSPASFTVDSSLGTKNVLNWTQPVALAGEAASGVDGGGYVVVRYSLMPEADNDPNNNGIYAKDNTFTSGVVPLTGTVVYIGTALTAEDVISSPSSYYYKIYAVDKAFNYSIELTRTGASTTWDGNAWLNGIPSSTVEAVVDGTYNGAGFDAKKLTVNSGKSLTITSGNLTVQNEVINNGTLVVNSGANLIQVNGTVNNNAGNITVNRNSNALYRLDYTMWSSPVSGIQTLADFSPLTLVNRFYTYNSSTNLYNSIASTATFQQGKGYLIRMPDNADAVTAAPYAGQFTGVPNNGTVSLPGLTAGQYVAVGNPYPSTISANAFIDANADVPANGVLYYWRKTNNINQGTSPTTSYATYTKAGGVANGGFTPGADIQVGQGFITTVPNTGAITFTNAMRSSNNSAQFLRTKATAEKDRVWLNLSAGTNPVNQMLVAYMDGATQGVDAGIDGKYINDSALALTSSINGEEYVIQGRPAFDASDVVPLNFKTDTAGNYTIAIDHADGVFAAGQDVLLVDAVAGTETSLKSGSYTFTAPAGTANSRFSLKYQKTLGVNDAVYNESSVAVYKNKGVVTVNSAAAIAGVKVYDIQGRLLAELKDVKASSVAVSGLKASNQVLVVQVTLENGAAVTKKVVN